MRIEIIHTVDMFLRPYVVFNCSACSVVMSKTIVYDSSKYIKYCECFGSDMSN